MNYSGTARTAQPPTQGVVTYEQPINRNLIKWLGFTTIAIILLVLILNLIFYFTRSVWFSPYKAQPSGKDTDYYPNGKPEESTGVPAGSSTLPKGVADTLQANMNAYNSISGSANAGWGYIANPNPAPPT